MADRPAVRYDVARGVATLTLDQADNRNALSAALVDGLGDALERGVADQSARVLVLTNEGSTFCAGADLSSAGRPAAGGRDVPGVLAQILDSPKPVVARIAGHCMGGGVGLAAACDLSVATTETRFGFTEVRLGVAPAIISVVCLPKLRRGDALELFLSGERIPAARAAEVGLINRAAEAAQLDEVVDRWVTALVAGGPLALAAAKRLVFAVPEMARDAAFAHTAEVSADLFGSAEAAEGIAAFRAKRPPAWIPEPGGP